MKDAAPFIHRRSAASLQCNTLICCTSNRSRRRVNDYVAHTSGLLQVVQWRQSATAQLTQTRSYPAMTSKTTTLTQVREELERFPDFPPRDDMQNWFYLPRIRRRISPRHPFAERHRRERGPCDAQPASRRRCADTGPAGVVR